MVNLAETFAEESGFDSRNFLGRMERKDFLSRGRSSEEISDYFE